MNTDLKQETAAVHPGLRARAANAAAGRRGRDAAEKRLLELVRDGDQEGLREIIYKYHEKLLSVANRICKNPADAEEVVQDVYMIAIDKIDRFEGRSTLSTWLYRITVNTALMKLRSRRTDRNLVPIDGMTALLGEAENVLRYDEDVKSPDDVLLTKELSETIRESIASLPEIYRSVFFLRDVQGYSIKEASRMLGTSPGAIKSRLHRSRFFLRKKLDPYLSTN